MYEPASLGMFQCRLQRILCDFEVIMFFRKDPPQTEGRRDADPLMPNQNVAGRRVRAGPEGGAARPADGHVDVMLGGVLFGFIILSIELLLRAQQLDRTSHQRQKLLFVHVPRLCRSWPSHWIGCYSSSARNCKLRPTRGEMRSYELVQ